MGDPVWYNVCKADIIPSRIWFSRLPRKSRRLIPPEGDVKGGDLMKKKTKCLAAAAILAGGLLAAAIYTRPRTIAQRYPFLDLDQCIQIHGYYSEGIQAEDTRFLITPEDPHFKEALRLFGSPAFRTKLGNLLPRRTKTHRYSEGDFQWIVLFRFESVLFPSKDTGTGDLLHVNNFYGDLTLHSDGETVQCGFSGQEPWTRDVMDIITLYPVSEQPPASDSVTLSGEN